MKKFTVLGVVVCFVFGLPLFAGAINVPASTYSETLPQSAFEKGDVSAAVKMLLNANVPIALIIKAAKNSGVSPSALVEALLAAGIEPEKIILFCLQGDLDFESALGVLNERGTPPEQVLTWLIQWETGLGGLYETCDFMLRHDRTKADLLRALAENEAERELVVQVVRWFNIPPATVIAVYHSFLDFFGHVFNRHSLPQPALLAIGVSRITIEGEGRRPVISPMVP